MKILISGSFGMIGTALINALCVQGHQIARLIRKQESRSEKVQKANSVNVQNIEWDPHSGKAKKEEFEGFDAVINLAGENIANGFWTAGKKQRIRDSRVIGTQNLCKLLASLQAPPKVLINASAIGFYGNRDEHVLSEEAPSGKGFLADVCRSWEAATEMAVQKGIRVVLLRFGIVLSKSGGMLSRLQKPFKLGLGGVLGSGKQYMSWVAIDDLVAAVIFILKQESLRGPLNVISPNPVTNVEFTDTLAGVLQKPTFLHIPAFILKLILGEMADEMLLTSTRVMPQKLLSNGFQFRYPTLKEALIGLIVD